VTVALAIQSVGPPPERHANRVVAQMARHLARTHADVWTAISEVIASSSDGGPRAQRRMAERIEQAGALGTHLTPGKRGRYTLIAYNLVGWDRARDAAILAGDPIPEQPQIACNLTAVESEGRGRDLVKITSRPMLLVTHHCLSRAAQRFGVRTSAHLVAVTTAIWNTAFDLLCEKADIDAWLAAPLEGWRVPIDGVRDVTVVLKRHEKRAALVAATMFAREEGR
jgi:hypothetical protein